MFERIVSRYYVLLAMAGISYPLCHAAELLFTGNSLTPIEIVPERSTGLDKIYVLYSTEGVDFVYKTTVPTRVKIYKYSNLGGAYAEEVTGVEYGATQVTLHNIAGDCGYIIEDGDTRYYYWIVDYLPHRFDIKSIDLSPDSECDATILKVEGNGAPIHYYSISGVQRILSRDINVKYDTQEWSDTDKNFNTVSKTDVLESMGTQIRIMPPAYCSTSFEISGDRFLKYWSWEIESESTVFTPNAVDVRTEALQEDESSSSTSHPDIPELPELDGADEVEDGEPVDEVGSNIITNGDDTGLGGSAPAQIQFFAYVTEGVLHHEWQMSNDPEFSTIDYRFNEQNLDYTFYDEGTYYLRYVGSNSDGSCESIGNTYTVTIGASELLCPNIFTPDGDGINDEWKVAYRSLLDFKCWIFDRYGAQIFQFDDPSKGWDGKYHGKLVKPGVYFYVIQATGADGKKYKKSGDINILRRKIDGTTISTPEE